MCSDHVHSPHGSMDPIRVEEPVTEQYWTVVLGVVTLLLFIEVAWVSVNDPI